MDPILTRQLVGGWKCTKIWRGGALCTNLINYSSVQVRFLRWSIFIKVLNSYPWLCVNVWSKWSHIDKALEQGFEKYKIVVRGVPGLLQYLNYSWTKNTDLGRTPFFMPNSLVLLNHWESSLSHAPYWLTGTCESEGGSGGYKNAFFNIKINPVINKTSVFCPPSCIVYNTVKYCLCLYKYGVT